MLFKHFEIEDRVELETYIKENLPIIHSDIVIIGEKIGHKKLGVIDLLGVNRKGQLVIIKFEKNSSNTIILQALALVKWINDNIDLIKKIPSKEKINEFTPPKIIIISPKLSFLDKNCIPPLFNYEIELYEYKGIQSKDGKGIWLELVESRGKIEHRAKQNKHSNSKDSSKESINELDVEITEEEKSAFLSPEQEFD